MMNNMNEFKYLKKWCEKHYENTKIRVNPQNVPVSTLLNEIIGRLENIESFINLMAIEVRAKEAETNVKAQEPKKPAVKKKLTTKKEAKDD